MLTTMRFALLPLIDDDDDDDDDDDSGLYAATVSSGFLLRGRHNTRGKLQPSTSGQDAEGSKKGLHPLYGGLGYHLRNFFKMKRR